MRKYKNKDREISIGDRVKSDEVKMIDYEGTYQEKHLEIVELLENIVGCEYYNENETTPDKEYYEVSYDSLSYINSEGLKYKTADQDEFWNRSFKK